MAETKPTKIAHPFYSSQAWHRVRTKALMRDQYRCTNCQASVKGKGMARVDHRRPRKYLTDAQALDLDMLRVLCVACDNARHVEKGYAGKDIKDPLAKAKASDDYVVDTNGFPTGWKP
jgi:5-methylcytosine-specific restriction endonuclease McrA